MNRSDGSQMSPATEMALTVLREFDQQLPEGDAEGVLQRDSAVFKNLGATSAEIHGAFASLMARHFIEEVGDGGYRITPAGRNLARSQSFQDYLLDPRREAEKQGHVDEAALVASRPAAAPAVPISYPPLPSRTRGALIIGAIVVLATVLAAVWLLVLPNQTLLDPRTLASPRADADGCVAILYSEWKLIEKGGEQGLAASSLDERIKTRLQALNTSTYALEVNWKETEEARQLQGGCFQACKLYMAATGSNSPPHERDVLFGSVKDCLDRLIKPQAKHYELKLDVGGNGGGSIATSLSGRCEGRCTETHRVQDTVMLHATPRGSSRFVGWAGDCEGRGPCQFTMDSNKTVTAVFEAAVQPVKLGCRDAYIAQEHSSWVIECQCDGKAMKTSGAFPSTHRQGSPEFLRAADARKKRDAWTCP